MLQPVTGQICSQGPRPTPTYSKPAILQKCKKALFRCIFNFLKSILRNLLNQPWTVSSIHKIKLNHSTKSHLISSIELSCCSKIRGQPTLYEKNSANSARKLEEICAQNLPVEKSLMTSKDVEAKPPLINQHCIVCKFSCDLCDIDYVGYTSQHLFQRITEHKHSSTGKHLKDEHSLQPTNLQDQFTVIKKCRTKIDCLIYEKLFIRSIKSKSNSICTKSFT